MNLCHFYVSRSSTYEFDFCYIGHSFVLRSFTFSFLDIDSWFVSNLLNIFLLSRRYLASVCFYWLKMSTCCVQRHFPRAVNPDRALSLTSSRRLDQPIDVKQQKINQILWRHLFSFTSTLGCNGRTIVAAKIVQSCVTSEMLTTRAPVVLLFAQQFVGTREISKCCRE